MIPRRPAFSGSWYPDNAHECRQQIEQFLADADRQPDMPGEARAGVVPHAGWFYSGAVACQVIQAMSEGEIPDAIVLFGMHMHPSQRPIIMAQGAWGTPLGPLPIADNLANYLTERFEFSIETPHDPNRDNTIELQLPFIRYYFGEIPILPIGVPPFAGRPGHRPGCY